MVGLCPSCLKLRPQGLGSHTGAQASFKTSGEYLSITPGSLGFCKYFQFVCSPNHENCPRTDFPGFTQGLAQLGNLSVVMLWFVLVVSLYGAAFKEKCCLLLKLILLFLLSPSLYCADTCIWLQLLWELLYLWIYTSLLTFWILKVMLSELAVSTVFLKGILTCSVWIQCLQTNIWEPKPDELENLEKSSLSRNWVHQLQLLGQEETPNRQWALKTHHPDGSGGRWSALSRISSADWHQNCFMWWFIILVRLSSRSPCLRV